MNPNVTYAPKPSKGSFTPKPKKGSGFTPRPWTVKCAKKLRGVRFSNISAPCGSGKTVCLTMLAAQELADTGLKQKQLIIAPQRVIGDSFTETRTITVDGISYTWAPELNDFVNYQQSSVIEGLQNWLLSEPKDLLKTIADKQKLDEVVAVTSHQALSLVWRKMKPAQRDLALKNLTITVDEAHHIAGVFDENGTEPMSDEETEEANHLGVVIQAAIHAKSTHVRLATATFYRGDSQPILDKKIAGQFAKGTYILSWVDHWNENLHPLESFRIDYRFYKTEPITATLAQISKGPDHIFMVFVPPSSIAWRKGNTSRMKALMSGLHKQFGEDAVLDLVTQGNTQDANVRRLRKDVTLIKKGAKPQFRCIVSCGIGLEGMDYEPVDRLINLGVQNSIVRAIQVMGRPMRAFAGKKKVLISNHTPQPHMVGKVSLSEALADRTNAMLTCLAWDDITHPIIVKLMSMSPKGKHKHHKSTLAEALGSKYGKVLTDALTAVEFLPKKTDAAVSEAIAKVLDKAGFHGGGLVDALLVAVRRAQLKGHNNPKANKLSNLFDVKMLRTKKGINLIKQYDLENRPVFFGDCTTAELKLVKKAITELGMTDEEFMQSWMKYHGGAE